MYLVAGKHSNHIKIVLIAEIFLNTERGQNGCGVIKIQTSKTLIIVYRIKAFGGNIEDKLDIYFYNDRCCKSFIPYCKKFTIPDFCQENFIF